MNMYYLVKFTMDWCDEFDVCGVSVCDSVRYDHEKQVATDNADFVFSELYFGSNESFCDISMVELFDGFKFFEISETTYHELKHQFINDHSDGFGTWFIWPSSVLEAHK